MKIAYVSYNLMHSIANGGVGLKIRTAVRSWQDAGYEAHWFTSSSAEVIGEDVTAFRFDAEQGLFRREIDRARQLVRMIDAIKVYQPDVIYLRAGIYTCPLQRLFRIAPVVMELNTIDVMEYRMQGRFHYLVHRLTRDFVYSRAAGFVAVSYEISAHPSNTKFGKLIQVVANGIDLSRYKPLPAPRNAVPRLAYIGAPDNPWQGLDKLLWLADACPDFEFDVIGSGPEHFAGQTIPPNVHLYGFLMRDAYESILARADVGVGTLALHRKGMGETSTLKVGEYLAYGLPLILAFDETGLKGTDFDFVLQLPNTEDNLRQSLERIREFVFCVQGKRVDRKMIVPLIDQRKKEDIRLDFLKQFASGGN